MIKIRIVECPANFVPRVEREEKYAYYVKMIIKEKSMT